MGTSKSVTLPFTLLPLLPGLLWEFVMRTDDTESRGSFRCGFYSGFYPALHRVSNGSGWLPEFVSIARPELPPRDRFPHRRPRSFPPPQFFRATTLLLLPAPLDPAGLPAGG